MNNLIEDEIAIQAANAKGFVVPESIAVTEFKAFFEFHQDEEISEEQVAKDFRESVKAIMRGHLNISDMSAPTLTLKDPVKDDKGAVVIDSISFLTRIKPGPLAQISRGIDMSKDSLALLNRMVAYLIQQPAVAMLDKFEKTDYKIIQQVTGLFQ